MDKPRVGFIGQGFIGKNYADDFESRGFQVVRYALEKQYKENGAKIKDCDIVFIAVPTPSTPDGFDDSIVRSAVKLIGEGKTAVIKSTILPGTTKSIQEENKKIIVLYSPEFLSEATAAHDASHPFSNIVGTSGDSETYHNAAQEVQGILPKAPYTLICDSGEAEFIKYTHNISGYIQIVTFNMMYDLARKMGYDWDHIGEAIKADPLVCNRYANPLHKSGRGAGGNCFIKDFAALANHYEKLVGDQHGVKIFRSVEEKNKELLLASHKDLKILEDVYGVGVKK